MKKLQDNVQYLQLRLAAKEHTCKNLQEKVNLNILLCLLLHHCTICLHDLHYEVNTKLLFVY